MSSSSEVLRQHFEEQERALRLPGAVLFSQSRYEIIRMLGEGGMGITCLADEISAYNLRRPVVLKFMKDSFEPHRLSRFLNEVQLSVLFSHPNLVPMYRLESEALTVNPDKLKIQGLGRRRGHMVFYAVMQFIDGWNLRDIVRRLRELGIVLNRDIALFVIGRIARGMHYVHEHCDESGEHLELVHRDISPENILVDRFGRIKVSDFGIAMSMKRMTDSGFMRAGNPLYCSPEQLQGTPLDRRTDIYNMGLIMYFLFTGTDRFGVEARQKNRIDRIRRVMAKSPMPDLTGTDPRLATMCERCLQLDRARRYDTCEDLANEIDMFFKETGTVVNNEQVEDVLSDLFSPSPKFVSPRYLAMAGSSVLDQPDFDPRLEERSPESAQPLSTVRLDQDEEE